MLRLFAAFAVVFVLALNVDVSTYRVSSEVEAGGGPRFKGGGNRGFRGLRGNRGGMRRMAARGRGNLKGAIGRGHKSGYGSGQANGGHNQKQSGHHAKPKGKQAKSKGGNKNANSNANSNQNTNNNANSNKNTLTAQQTTMQVVNVNTGASAPFDISSFLSAALSVTQQNASDPGCQQLPEGCEYLLKQGETKVRLQPKRHCNACDALEMATKLKELVCEQAKGGKYDNKKIDAFCAVN